MQQKSGQFFGETCHQETASGLILSENRYVPGQTTDAHTHESALCYLVLGGVCDEKTARRFQAHPAATVAFLNAGETHATRWQPDGEGRCFHLEIAPAFRTRLLHRERPFPDLDSLSAPEGTPPSRLLRRLYTEFLRWDRYSALIAEGIALELLGELGRAGARPVSRDSGTDSGSVWLARVEARLRERFDVPPTLTELSDLAGVHPSHLLRVFRQHYHMTPGAFVRQCRIDEACRRLRTATTAEPNIALGQLAQELGFADQSHFSRTFRALTGISPGTFRRTSR